MFQQNISRLKYRDYLSCSISVLTLLVVSFRILTVFSVSQFAQQNQQFHQLSLLRSQRLWQRLRKPPECRAGI